MYESLYPNVAWVNQRRALLFAVAGRLKPGVALPHAEAATQVIAQDLEREYPRDNAGRRVQLTEASVDTMAAKTRATILARGHRARDRFRTGAADRLRQRRQPAAGARRRTAARRSPCAWHWAPAAGSWCASFSSRACCWAYWAGRQAWHSARWARDLLWSMKPPMFNHAGFALGLDTQVFAYTFAVALATGIIFGLAPRFRSHAHGPGGRSEGTDGPRLAGTGTGPDATGAGSGPGGAFGGRFGRRRAVPEERLERGSDRPGVRRPAHRHRDLQPGRLGIRRGPRAAVSRSGRWSWRRRRPGWRAAALSKDAPLRVSAARTVLLDGQQSTASAQGTATLTSVVVDRLLSDAADSASTGPRFQPAGCQDGAARGNRQRGGRRPFLARQDPIGKVIHFYGDAIAGGGGGSGSQRQLPGYRRGTAGADLPFPDAVLLPDRGGLLPHAGRPRGSGGRGSRATCSRSTATCCCRPKSLELTMRQSLWAQRLSAGLLAVFGAAGAAAGGRRDLRSDLVFREPAGTRIRCADGAGRDRR